MKTETNLCFDGGDFNVFSEKTKKAGIDNSMSYSKENLKASCARWFQSHIKLFEQIHICI